MFITAFFHSISAFFFKLAMTFSHLHYQSALILVDPHIIFNHYKYATMFKFTRPLMAWKPF